MSTQNGSFPPKPLVPIEGYAPLEPYTVNSSSALNAEQQDRRWRLSVQHSVYIDRHGRFCGGSCGHIVPSHKQQQQLLPELARGPIAGGHNPGPT
ncbi:unnamed protein product [Lampetra planeri]